MARRPYLNLDCQTRAANSVVLGQDFPGPPSCIPMDLPSVSMLIKTEESVNKIFSIFIVGKT